LHEALDWLRQGLEAAQEGHSEEETALHIRIGPLLTNLGHRDQALVELQKGLERLPSSPTRLRIAALGNLGNIYCIRGDIERGLAYYRQVLETAQAMNDYWAMAEVWINLGIELDIAGRWGEALAQYQQALEQAERLGSLEQRARSLLALGNTYFKQGDNELAKSNLEKCIAIAQSRGWTLIIYAWNSLASVHLSMSETEQAENLLTEAEHLAQVTGVRDQLPETYRNWALVRLGQWRLQEALAYAEQSVSQAQEFQSYSDEGTGLRVLGQVQWANSHTEEALASFEKSLAVLADRDPYETARTKVEWAKCLRSQDDPERSTLLLQEARATFQQLGAQRDLANLDDLADLRHDSG
jgi:tetratricopeptide (TPR) repeat protein